MLSKAFRPLELPIVCGACCTPAARCNDRSKVGHALACQTGCRTERFRHTDRVAEGKPMMRGKKLPPPVGYGLAVLLAALAHCRGSRGIRQPHPLHYICSVPLLSAYQGGWGPER